MLNKALCLPGSIAFSVTTSAMACRLLMREFFVQPLEVFIEIDYKAVVL